MTTHFITADQGFTETGTTDTLYEAQGVVISGGIDMRLQSDDMTFGGGGQQTLFLNGGVFGSVDDYGGPGSGDDQITIGTAGYVDSNSGSNIELSGGGNVVTNNGTISASNYADDIYLVGNEEYDQDYGDTIINTGTITGTDIAGRTGDAVISCNSVTSVAIQNTGSILAGGGAVAIYAYLTGVGSTLFNAGLIVGNISMSDAAVGFDNEGTIQGSISLDTGSVFRNGGTITGSVSLGSGADAILDRGGVLKGTLSGTDLTLTTHGTITGDVEVTGTVRNVGTIQGSVVFGTGTNVFDGRGGSVEGTVTGGSGADKLIAGSDGETLAGGAGRDRLYGGAGADTFAFSSFKSADADLVVGFDVSKDTIQLDHTVFTRLTAGSTPKFAVGTKPSSATDYLFYNSATGVLAYDTNGSATGGAHTVATLSTGLKLTASDFSIV